MKTWGLEIGMMKLIKIYKPYALWVLVIFALLFVQAMTDLALPDYMSNIVNNGITTGDTGYILQEGGKMLLVALLGAVCTILVGFLSARLAAGTARNLRHDVFRKVERFSNAEFDRFSTASLITRTTNDIQQIQMLSVMALRFVFYAPIMGVGGVVKAVTKSPNLSWIIAVAVLVVIGLVLVLFSLSVPKFKLVQKLVDRLNLVTRESLTGMMVIRAFNTQKREEERFDEVNRDLTKTNLFVNRLMVFMMPVMMFVMNAVQITIIWIGAGQVDAGAIQVGDMMAFMQYAMQIIMSFLMISVMFIMLPRASVSAERINEVLDTEPVIQDKDAPKHFPSDFKGVVEFHDVTFTYPGASEPVLNDINFVAKPGETTAFIGSTGSGKSTLVNLIDRFYDVSAGHISIDGVDIRDVTQHELREKIGFVPQKGVLFSGTIASNLRYGKEDAAEQELIAASRIAQAAEFIDEKENRYDSDIAQGGGNVSGGQKQRLSIARALVKQAPIYIFDDSFSALDFKTDAALRRALKQETGESTVLIVAQRISTIMGAEQIIVLDEGRIVGKGTHRELLQNCAVYREIAQSQLSEEELEL
jgi:ATP-binding cassette subfamily B multidrug efflux pump